MRCSRFGGIFFDRFGTRVTYSLALTLWSAFTAFMGVISSLPMLLVTRVGVGVFEAPCFPANSRILATWFPQQERARANSIYSVGQYAGIAFLSVPLFWITQQFGWRGLFFIAGGFGILLGILFWVEYREPSEDRHVGADEIAHIEAGGGGEQRRQGRVQLERHWPAASPSPDRRRVNRTVWRQLDPGVLRDLVPTYPVNVRGMSFINAGMMTMLPYIGASIGVLVAGQISDRILKQTGSANVARKLPIVGGMLLASTIVIANFVWTYWTRSSSRSCQWRFSARATNLGWTVISDVAPKELIGLTAGIFNFSANLAGIVTPLVIGYTYQRTGSFFGPLVYIGVVALVGAFSYSVILGDIRRLTVNRHGS